MIVSWLNGLFRGVDKFVVKTVNVCVPESALMFELFLLTKAVVIHMFNSKLYLWALE